MNTDMIAKITLAPLLIAQGLMVRRRALILPEPPGDRQGRTGQGPTLRLLILGDSSAAGVGANHQETALSGRLSTALAPHFDLTWQLIAKTGSMSGDSLRALERMPPQVFDIAVTALGVNDVTGNVSLTRWVAQQKAIHHLLRIRFGVRHIFASGLPPMGSFPLLPNPLRWVMGVGSDRLDAAMAQMALDTPDLSHLKFDLPFAPEYSAADGFHPSELAYQHWADMLAPLIIARARA